MDYIEEGLFKKRQKVVFSSQDRKNIVKKINTFLNQNVKKYDKKLNIEYKQQPLVNEFLKGEEDTYTILIANFDYNKELADDIDKLANAIKSHISDNRVAITSDGNFGYRHINLSIKDYIEESYIEENSIIEEDAGVVASLLFMGLIFGPDIAKGIKKLRPNKKYSYIIQDKQIKSVPSYGYENAKIALSNYAYYDLKIRNAEKNTLLYTSKSILNKEVYLYKFTSDKLLVVDRGSFEELCEKHNLKLKPMNESKIKDRDKVYKQTVSLVKQELNKYKELKSKVDFKHYGDEYDNFINGMDDTVSIFYGDLWDIIPNARSDEGQELATKIVYEPMTDILKTVNSKLPKDYKVSSEGDWDDVDIYLTYTGKVNESYTPERGEIKMKSINSLANIARSYGIEPTANRLRDDIVEEYTDIINSLSMVDESVIVRDIALLPVYKINEGYAIDLDTLKYVVESKEMTIQEAIQEIRDVNYIGDTIPMYCILPENINENINLESFINLTESLNKYEITPISIREFNETEFVIQETVDDAIMNNAKRAVASGKPFRIKTAKRNAQLQLKNSKNGLETTKNYSKEQKDKLVKNYNRTIQYAGMPKTYQINTYEDYVKEVNKTIAKQEKIIKMCDDKLNELESKK